MNSQPSCARLAHPGGWAVLVLGLAGLAYYLTRPTTRPSHGLEPTAGDRLLPSQIAVRQPGPPEATADPPSKAIRPDLVKNALPAALQLEGALTVGDAMLLIAGMNDDASRSQYYQNLLRYCLRQDPAGAAELAAAFGDTKLRELGVSFVLLHWGEADPVAALGWAANHPRGENDRTRIFAAYEGVAALDPLAALTMLRRPELGNDLDALGRIAVFHAQQQGQLADARAWIEQLPEGATRDLLVGHLVHFWAETSPTEAARWLASVAPDDVFRSGIRTLLHELVQTDPHGAADLTQLFKSPAMQQDQLADVIYLWAQRDLGGAAAWLRAQPPDARFDAAIARLVDATARYDPVEARMWINRITNEEIRTSLQRRLNLRG